MQTKMDFKIACVLDDYEVIGHGGMIYTPQQIGQWWIVPAQDYKGKIPPDIQRKMFELVNQGVAIQGFLIAEDMAVIEARRKREQEKKEATEKAVKMGMQALAVPFIALRMGLILFVSALMAFDPMLIGILEDGSWICLGTWFD